MTKDASFDELLESVKDKFQSGSRIDIDDHISVHVNVTDMGNKPFYIEISEGQINVEPYGYFNSDAVMNADSQILTAMINRQVDMRTAYSLGRFGAYGNLYKLAELRNIFEGGFLKKGN